MAQAGYTPIQIYNSATASAAPSAGNLATGELALNITDGKLFYKDNGGVVQVLATKGAGTIGGSDTQVQYNSSGALAGSANMTFNGTTLSVNGLTVSGTSTLSALTASTALALNASKEVVSVTNTGSGNNVLATSPTLVTPVLGAATATSVNGLTVSSTTGTLTLANGSTLATSGANSLTMTTTGATNVTFPTSGTLATTGGTVASFSAGSTGFTPNTATTGAVTLAGTLATTNGGTGLTSFTANGVVYASSTSALTTGSALTFDGTNLGVGTSSPAQLFHAKKDQAAYTWARVDNQSSSASAYSGWMLGAFGNSWGMAMGSSAANSNALTWVLDAGGANSEKMRLDSSGNLGIGLTNPAYRLDVSISSGPYSARFNNTNTSTSEYNVVLVGQAASGSAVGYFGTGGSAVGNAAFANNLVVGTQTSSPLVFNTGDTERARITSGGDLLVGTTTQKVTQFGGAATGMTIGGASYPVLALWDTADASYNFMLAQDGGTAFVFNNANGPLTFSTNATERARITSVGDLLVGTTSIGYTSSGSTYFSPTAQYWIGNHASGTASGTRYWGFGLDVNELGSITQNSTTGVLYNITSDRRLKNNIAPAPNASNDIDAIQIVSHGWKFAPDEHVKYGVIAQDLHAVAPQAVKKGDDGEDIVETWGVDYSKLVPMLIKEIQSLRARVAALEA
jgi:hypothetical protein